MMINEDQPKYGKLSAESFSVLKFILSVSLSFDTAILATCICSLIRFEMADGFWALKMPIVNTLLVFVLLAFFIITVYSHTRLVVMNLSRFHIFIFMWIALIMCIVITILGLCFEIVTTPDVDTIPTQQQICDLIPITSYCQLRKLDYLLVTFLISSLIIIYKLAQLLCIRSLFFAANDAIDESEIHRNQRPSSGNQNDGTDSEDDDVIVFERVLGRPGMNSIKDATVS